MVLIGVRCRRTPWGLGVAMGWPEFVGCPGGSLVESGTFGVGVEADTLAADG